MVHDGTDLSCDQSGGMHSDFTGQREIAVLGILF